MFPKIAIRLIAPILLSLLCDTAGLKAQTEDIWISTGTIHARVTTGGYLLSDFLVPGEDTPMVGANYLSLWIGGVDPAGNLGLAIQDADTAKSDYSLGFRGVPGSERVWKITKVDIEQHIQDYADNGFIDNPIEAVYAWPAVGNPFSLLYNGFDSGQIPTALAAPFTPGFPSVFTYSPDDGDFPSIGQIIYNTHRIPDEIVYIPFYERKRL